jgi:hypothetical protein
MVMRFRAPSYAVRVVLTTTFQEPRMSNEQAMNQRLFVRESMTKWATVLIFLRQRLKPGERQPSMVSSPRVAIGNQGICGSQCHPCCT